MSFKKLTIFFCIFVISFFMVTTSLASSEIYVWSPTSEPLNNSIQTSANVTNSNTNVVENPTKNATSSEVNTAENATSNEVTNTLSNTSTLTNTTSVGTDLNLECGGAVLIEQNSGRVLYDHNMHQKLRPASVTKVMSLLLIMEAIDSGRLSYTDKIPCTEEAAAMGGSQIWLDVREELTVDEMLKAICVVSANDCTVAMAEY